MPAVNKAFAQFTATEKRIGALVAKGLRNRDIAPLVGHTELTVRQDLTRIYDKSGTWSRLEFALWWLRHKSPANPKK